MMSEQLRVAPNICTCGESNPGVVIVFHGHTEHHCSLPSPCWNDEPLSVPGIEPFVDVDALVRPLDSE
jgi:hypothetical protein